MKGKNQSNGKSIIEIIEISKNENWVKRALLELNEDVENNNEEDSLDIWDSNKNSELKNSALLGGVGTVQLIAPDCCTATVA